MEVRIVVKTVVILAVTGLVAAGCAVQDPMAVGGATAIGSSNDINPQPVSALRDDGNLRLTISAFPENWNALHVDGNDAEIGHVLWPMMPRSCNVDAAGELTVNHDYFTDIRLTNTDPQQVTYTINPKAVWSDGSPITWEDIASQANAVSGRDPRFLMGATNGFERVAKVDRGVDDRQAVLTYSQHFADWKGQLAGNSMLYPKSVTADPEAFNKSLVNGISLTSGPFRVVKADRGSNRITLGRNPLWWGARPKLDTITYLILDNVSMVSALQNDELDAIDLVRTIDQARSIRNTPGITVRRTPDRQFAHVTFNGSNGSILSDPKLRVAVMKGIDRKAIAKAVNFGLIDKPQTLDNHVYLRGTHGYRDNSGPIAYDPEQAERELDALGWKLNGKYREKNGRRLKLRDVMYNSTAWVFEAKIMQQTLAAIGVQLELDVRGGQGYFRDVIIPGDFDLAQFYWVGDVTELTNLPQIYGYDPKNMQSNYGHIGSPEINTLIDQTLSELDPVKAIDLANQVDRAVFAEGHSLPMFQSPGNVGVRETLANYGAFGLASIDYTKVGYMK